MSITLRERNLALSMALVHDNLRASPDELRRAVNDLGDEVRALRQRHAEAVELLVRASDMLHHTVFWTPDGEQHPHPDCPACQWQAAWPASEAKAALEADHIVGLGNMVEVARDGT